MVERLTQVAAKKGSDNPFLHKTFSSWKHSRHTERGSLEDLIWFLRDTITDILSAWTDEELEEQKKRKIASSRGGRLY